MAKYSFVLKHIAVNAESPKDSIEKLFRLTLGDYTTGADSAIGIAVEERGVDATGAATWNVKDKQFSMSPLLISMVVQWLAQPRGVPLTPNGIYEIGEFRYSGGDTLRTSWADVKNPPWEYILTKP